MASLSGKVIAAHNKNYKASGTKSYVHLLHKYKFQPTKPGPYFFEHVHHHGHSKDTQKHEHKHHHDQSTPTHKHEHKHHDKPADASASSQLILRKRTAQNTVGEVSAADNQNDCSYLCSVNIGTPAQKFTLDFDTGSSDLWMWSVDLPKTINTKGHSVFDPKKTHTFKSTPNGTWRITYGDSSSSSGVVGTDTVDIGGLSIKSQTVELANSLSAQFVQDTADGLLGLAFGSLNTVYPTRAKTPIENMIATGVLPKDKQLFTVYLCSYKDINNPDKGQSFYTFGSIDQKALGGQIPTYTPIDNSQGFWMFKTQRMVIGGLPLSRPKNVAIADTGTTLALIEDSACQAVYNAIPGAHYDSDQQGYLFPTNTTFDKLPDISFDVGGVQFALHKEDLGFVDLGNGMTYGGIQSRGELPFDILGDTFLKSVYAIFDQGKMRFGVVQRPDLSGKSAAGAHAK